MNREELIKILHATETPDKIAKWLREQYFPEIMNRYNSEASRKRFGLYRNEQIPSNERNLTDVRTRMGVLIPSFTTNNGSASEYPVSPIESINSVTFPYLTI